MANNTLLKLKEDEREKRREIILLAAQKLFSEKGIAGISMRDIAKEAGVSVGFIYRYFPGQTEIFVELFEAGRRQIIAKIKTEVNGKEPKPLQRLAKAYVGYLLDNLMFFHMMRHFTFKVDLSIEATEKVNNSLRRIMDEVEVFFKGEGKDSRILAHSFFSAMNGVMISFVNYPGRTPEEIRKRTLLLAETIADQFDKGN